ncbi:MAG TPA: cytochrome c [Gemmatimonadales bacterium]|nr:cytochrome c [Gemmatimonadales bacterium]
MFIYRIVGIASALLMCAATSGHAQAETPTPLPAGVTPAMVAQGASIFKGQGMCSVCHGIDGKGGVGANLTDSTWLHSKGSYEEIVQQITTGVPQKESTNGVPMPPKGGSGINPEQVKAVAAYVWTLSHPGAK